MEKLWTLGSALKDALSLPGSCVISSLSNVLLLDVSLECGGDTPSLPPVSLQPEVINKQFLPWEEVMKRETCVCASNLHFMITLCQLIHRCRNWWGQSGHGLTTFLTCYYKAKLRARRVISLSHPLLADAIVHTTAIGTPWSMYCCASSEMNDAAVAIRPNCSSAHHSKVTHSLHKHLAWPLQFSSYAFVINNLVCECVEHAEWLVSKQEEVHRTFSYTIATHNCPLPL